MRGHVFPVPYIHFFSLSNFHQTIKLCPIYLQNFFFFYLNFASGPGRLKLGLPFAWSTIADWLNPKKIIFFPAKKPHTPATKKCPDIPQLSSYRAPPGSGFWRCFPFKNIPSHPSSLVNFRRLHEIISHNRNVLSLEQRIRADKVVHDLQSGSVVPFVSVLPSITVPNTASVVLHGEEFTDVLAWWIRNGYVAGPFDNPPLPDFRTNAMMAVEQRDKIRIVMNLSGPEGGSFNDAVNELALEKVTMSSARLFGYSVVECGIGARMWKYDMVDAYKTIPAAQSDLRLQGFTWLGKYFVELKKVFGSKEAVSAFDRLNHTIVVLAAKAGGPTSPIHSPHPGRCSARDSGRIRVGSAVRFRI